MQPFDEETELPVEPAPRKRPSTLGVVVVLGVLVLVIIAVVLHLAGGAPTHGR